MNDDETATMTNSVLSDQQLKVAIVLEVCTASLSVIGSSTIVFKILRDRAQNHSMTPYDRIILGLSSCDIIASFTYATYQFLKPSETGDVWAFGSPATCRAAGFLIQLSLWVWWYNGILSVYFLLKVLSQVQQKNFVRKCEPWMHLSGIFFPITAIMGLTRQWYNENLTQSSCWIRDTNIAWVVGGGPTILIFLFVIIINIVIYAVVRKSLRSEHFPGPTSVQKRLKKEATTLMLLYVTSFVVTVLPQFAKEIWYLYFYANSASYLYPLTILNAMLKPLQGFFNVFIYLKPAYTRFHAANPDKRMHFVLHQALFNPNVPQLTVLSDQSASNTIEEGVISDPAKEGVNSKRKTPRKKRRKKSDDAAEDDESFSDSTAS